MHVIELGNDLLLFQVDPPPGEFEGLNFLALVDNGRALFIDTGYKENMAEALVFLDARGVKPAGAIISHYHPDHADGLSLLGGLETWGGEGFEKTLSLCFRAERHASLAPNHRVDGPEVLAFGSHRIELFPLRGHSPDSLGAIIDGRILFAADALLFTNEGEPVLPSVHDRPVSNHAEALRLLKSHLDLVFVPGHGAPVTDRSLRERDLSNRLAYIEAIVSRPGIDLEEAQSACEPKFRGSEWHEENWK